MKVKLDDVIEAIELNSDEFMYFYNKETGEIILYEDSMITGFKDEELEDELEENYDKYIRLPTRFEINPYNIMEEFIFSLPEGRLQDKLEQAIQGRKAFRRFKDAVYDAGIEEKWFKYESDSYRSIAIEWCRDNGIRYE